MKNQIVKKKYLIIAAVGIVLLALLFLLIVLFANSEDEYSFLEKNWINSNVNNVIDINVPSDIPVFNSSGKGVFIDFVNDFELDTNLSLNVVTTNANSLRVKANTLLEFTNKKVTDVITDNDEIIDILNS